MFTEIKTGIDLRTTFYSQGKWKGQDVWVMSRISSCLVGGHALEVMHHCDDKGNHYCPTGFLMCAYCGGIADEPEPFQCTKWGKK